MDALSQASTEYLRSQTEEPEGRPSVWHIKTLTAINLNVSLYETLSTTTCRPPEAAGGEGSCGLFDLTSRL